MLSSSEYRRSGVPAWCLHIAVPVWDVTIDQQKARVGWFSTGSSLFVETSLKNVTRETNVHFYNSTEV